MTISTTIFRGIVPFVAVAEERSYSRAAARLGVTKAAVSKAVGELEREVGVVLFQRSSRGVSLTQEGARFHERCERAVTEVSGAREELKSARTAPSGSVKLSVSFIVADLVFPALARLQTRHPRLRFHLRVSDQLARFADEGVDVAVRVGLRREASLSAKLLRKTRWVTVASPAYLARSAPLRSVEDLAQHRRLAFVAPDGRQRAWSFRLAREAATRAVGEGALSIDFGPGLVGAARAGIGVAQVLDFMVDAELSNGELVELMRDESSDGPPIVAVHTVGRRPTANVAAVLESLVDAFRARPIRAPAPPR